MPLSTQARARARRLQQLQDKAKPTAPEKITAPVLWKPLPAQHTFLSSSADEVLFGGAAGGGKSDSLLIDALGLQHGAIYWGGYRALIIKRTYPELQQLIDRAKVNYTAIVPGVRWKADEWSFIFPSGAKVQFGYAKKDSDRFRYLGGEYQWIGIDELTLFASPVVWDFLATRLRSTNPAIPELMRATCNPGNVGHEWVKERWRIPDDGAGSEHWITVDLHGGRKGYIKRQFIPARLAENIYLLGSRYEITLSAQDEMTRRALLDGRWDVVEIPGSIYEREMQALYLQGRVGAVPFLPGWPVNTFWDLGRRDAMAIWWHQHVGAEHRFFRSESFVGAGLDQAAYMIRQVQEQHGLVYRRHYMPHDIKVTDLSAAGQKSRLDIAEELGITPIEVVKRTPNIWEGIDQTRLTFAACRFDAEGCEDGLRALRSYRKGWDEERKVWRMAPIHDWASDYADAFRTFGQGYAPDASPDLRRDSWRDRLKSRRGPSNPMAA